jgi:hypothetical protein
LRGVGGCIAAIDAVLGGQAKNAFVATRPPGHHAEKTRAMGFCLFSTVAIAARYALEHHGLSRVAVVDFDVHHGNGTQDVLWDEPRALFISSHQMPLYPGSGAANERGGSNNVLNLPLAPATDGAAMRVSHGQSRNLSKSRAMTNDQLSDISARWLEPIDIILGDLIEKSERMTIGAFNREVEEVIQLIPQLFGQLDQEFLTQQLEDEFGMAIIKGLENAIR